MTENSISSDRNRADALIRESRYEEAIEIYRRLTEARPEEDSHLLALAWALHDSGRPEEAAGCFERLFEKELTRRLFTGFAYDELVRIYREGKEWESLISVCERAADAQPEDAGLLRTLGEACLAAGKAERALHVFERLTALEPDSPDHWCSLGDAWLVASDPGNADVAYLRAAEIEPADAPVFFRRLAVGCLRAGHLEKARAAFARCLAARPAEPVFWIGLGDVLIRMGEPEAAVDAYGCAASLNPATAGSCYYRLGNLLTREGFHPLASEAFTKAVAAEPENPRFLLHLAASYTARDLVALADAALRRVEALTGSAFGKPRPAAG